MLTVTFKADMSNLPDYFCQPHKTTQQCCN